MEDITRKILRSIFIKRLEARKPVILGIFAKSGEGKSFTGLRIYELLMEMQRLDPIQFYDVTNITSPDQYADRVNKLLNEKKYPEYRRINILVVHEGRLLVRAKKWYEESVQAVSDINALSRQIKPLMIIIISQFLSDISKDIRLTMTHYAKVRRANTFGSHGHLLINTIEEDDYDIQRPKIIKRGLEGYLVYPDGSYRLYRPSYFEVNPPSKGLQELFMKSDTESKLNMLLDKLEQLGRSFVVNTDAKAQRVQMLFDFYKKNPELLMDFATKTKRGIKISGEFLKVHQVSNEEALIFSRRINEYMKIQRSTIEPGDTDGRPATDGDQSGDRPE